MPEATEVKIKIEGLEFFSEYTDRVMRVVTAAYDLIEREEMIDIKAWPEVNELRASLNNFKRWVEDERSR